MHVVRRSLGQELPNKNFIASLATPSHGATEVTVLRHRQSPGGHSPDHSHDHEETMVMLMGRVTVMVGNEPVALGSGDTLIIPPGTPHRIQNAGNVEAEWLLIAPTGIKYFDDAGREKRVDWTK